MLGLAELKEKTGAELSVFEKTVDFINEKNLNLGFHMGVECPIAEADRILKDGDEIDFHGNKIKVIHTPGHTEGGVCYLFDNTLVSGDTLFLNSIGRFDFPLGSFEDEINSIKNKLMCLSDDIKVYPGHGFSTSIGRERKENPYLQ
jgi:glyoxylase-like metal-dependent hydrolase (beta-lactamase superfamily II)